MPRTINVLVGPTCSTCEFDDLQPGAPAGALRGNHCRDCGTQYLRFELPDQPACRGCGQPYQDTQTGSAYCEYGELTDCAYCGATVVRSELSLNRACLICELGEVA